MGVGAGRDGQRALARVEHGPAGERDTHGATVAGRRAGTAAGKHAGNAAYRFGRHAALTRGADGNAVAVDAAADLGGDTAGLLCRGDHDTHTDNPHRGAERFAQHRRLVERRHADSTTGSHLARQRG